MDYEALNIALPYIISLLSSLMAILCLVLWRYDRKDELKRREELIKEQLVCQRKLYEIQLSHSKEPMVGTNPGGYISINLPEAQRQLFHDLLIGFENYARLHGYRVHFSVDNSVMQRIGFKLTLADEGVTVSTETVRSDLKEYLEKIRRGATFSDMPIIIPKKEHDLLLSAMKVRTDFIVKSYNLKEDSLELYEKVLFELSAHPSGISSFPNFPTQTNTAANQKETSAGKSEEQTLTNIPNLEIKIASSFNERKLQIEAVTKVIMLLKYDSHLEESNKERAILNLEKVKDELAEEERPDKTRLLRWFVKIAEDINHLSLAKEAATTTRQLFVMFNISTLLTNCNN